MTTGITLLALLVCSAALIYTIKCGFDIARYNRQTYTALAKASRFNAQTWQHLGRDDEAAAALVRADEHERRSRKRFP